MKAEIYDLDYLNVYPENSLEEQLLRRLSKFSEREVTTEGGGSTWLDGKIKTLTIRFVEKNN